MMLRLDILKAVSIRFTYSELVPPQKSEKKKWDVILTLQTFSVRWMARYLLTCVCKL